MACCSSCYCTPCSCAPITGEADAPQCLPPGSEVALDSIGGFDEFNCARALNPFRGFDSKGDPVTLVTTPTQAAFLVQDAAGNSCWSDRPKVILPEQQIGLATASTTPATANSIPNLVGVDTTGQWREVAANTGQTASTVKWNPTTGFTLKPDSNEPSLCTSLTSQIILTAASAGPYTAFVASTSSFTVGISVVILSKEYLVTALTSTSLTLTAATAPSTSSTVAIGTFVCGIGFKPVSGIASSYVDTLTGSLTTSGTTTSNSLTFDADVAGKKKPGLFWRDQLGQVTFIAAPVDATTGLITPNLTLKTPSVPTTNGANKLEFVPAPGAYTWITPTNISSYTYDVSLSPYGGPSTTPLVYNLFTAPGYQTGAKMVILDCKVMLSLGNTAVTSNVELKINDLFIAFVQSSSSFGSATDTNQIIVPIPTNGNLTLATTKNGSINNAYSQTIRVLGYIG